MSQDFIMEEYELEEEWEELEEEEKSAFIATLIRQGKR